jgi:hypothetical protein
MVEAKCLRYVAVPTNGSMRFQHGRQLFQSHFTPTDQLSRRAKKRGLMVEPVDF